MVAEPDAAREEPLQFEVLDAMESLARQSGRSLLERVVAAFETDAARQLRRMQTAVEGTHPDELRRAAHALKSSAASIGAERLAQMCAAVEEGARQGHIARAAETLEPLGREVGRVNAALLARLGSGGVHGRG